jgi:NTE family protein
VLEQQLRGVPFFRNLRADALAEIAQRLRLLSHPKGTVVFRKGDASDAMYLIQSGQVDVVLSDDSGDEPLASLGPGSFVGELGLLLDEPRSATLVVAADADMWAFDRGELDALLARYPSVAIELSREIGRRLVATNRRVSPSVQTRITTVWGEEASRLAEVLGEIGAGRVGMAALPGAEALSGVPSGVKVLPEDGHLDAEVIAGWAGARVSDLDHLVLVLPGAPDAAARAAVDLAEYLVAFSRPWPAWTEVSGRTRRVLYCDGSASGLRRVARWVSGRALGLALSSGGSKCLAHIGVLRVLQEEGIEIDAVAGTSGGALVAAACAFHVPDEQMMTWATDLARATQLRRFDVNVIPRAGLIKGVRLHTLFGTWTEGRVCEDSVIPLWTVATDADSGEEVVIGDGPVSDAIRASMSVPGVLNPWPHRGRMLIDGAVVNPMPARVLRDAGVRYVIGSNVAGQESARRPSASNRPPNLLRLIAGMRNWMEREMIKAQIPLVDVMIRPELPSLSTFDFSQVDLFTKEGERAARARLADVQALVGAPATH